MADITKFSPKTAGQTGYQLLQKTSIQEAIKLEVLSRAGYVAKATNVNNVVGEEA